MIFDSHCHPQFPQYDDDREEILARSFANKVNMICVGTDLEMSKRAMELANKHPRVWASIGIHPNEAANDEHAVDDFKKLFEHGRVIAVGEIGLDYYRTPEAKKQKIQKKVFQEFLDLAAGHDKPVIIHARDADKGSVGKVHSDIIEILTDWKSKVGNRHWRGGVVHSFTGTKEEAKKYLDLGFYIGFNGIITFSKQCDELIDFVPLDRILLETDAPYLAPVPYRGQRNEPWYVIEVAKRITGLKGEPYEKVLTQTTQNCRELFRISFKSAGFIPSL